MRHLAKRTGRILWAGIALLLASCAGLGDFGVSLGNIEGQALFQGATSALGGLLPIGSAEERAIGGAMAAQVVARYGGLYEDQAAVEYVNLVGKAVAMTSDRPEVSHVFGILNSDRVNAFATPGGYVFVTKGLLRGLRSEAELAYVLGHEIAHITEKHILKVIRRSRALAGVTTVTLAALEQDTAMFDEVINIAMGSLFEHGLDRRKEYAADQLGAEFAARVGYDPNAAREFLQRLGSLRADEADDVLLRTHPTADGRLKRVDGLLGKLDAPPGGWARLEDRYRAAMANAQI